jgi:hypothetical protein
VGLPVGRQRSARRAVKEVATGFREQRDAATARLAATWQRLLDRSLHAHRGRNEPSAFPAPNIEHTPSGMEGGGDDLRRRRVARCVRLLSWRTDQKQQIVSWLSQVYVEE